MVFGALKRFFSGEPETEVTEAKQDLRGFVEFVVRGLVDSPEQVKVTLDEKDDQTATISISCEKDDIGKVIGRSGRTISAIRSLVSDAAVHSQYRRTKVDVLD